MSNDLILLSLYLFAYAGTHSLLATDRVKRKLSGIFRGRDHAYRLVYSLLSTVALYPLFIFLRRSPQLYQIEGDLFVFAMRALQVVGAIGFLLSLRAVDLGIFVGLRPQVADVSQMPLSTTGPYAWCRHPLYFFAALFLLMEPSVSEAYAVFSVWTVAYFWAGSWIEEHRLINTYGAAYLEYKARVPHFIPLPYTRNADSS